MQNCNVDTMYKGSVKTLKQGESLTVAGRLFYEQGAVLDWTGYKIAFMVYSQDKELVFSSEEGRDGVLPVLLNDDGTFSFGIPGEMTRTMSGNYYIESKIEHNDKVSVSDKVMAFQVVESRIGASDKL